ncbi:hypothetical protein L0B70_07640 [Kaistella sp. 97-N-M2]|uniref:hypothetical protein n=1 Tax=Kaistella sp. 97-N-M2 TaxID=2908645 RepID=UPI001F15D027|nr:hypothetical protein [Kaistella sp. 97-N-M2]UJF28740.1 hypothetical protein L0B70_07640 [Kaistella sp. 97-N-M2]
MPHISSENFLMELSQIRIDHLNIVLKDESGSIIVNDIIGKLHNQILSLKSLKETMNLVTLNRKNEIFILSLGEMSYIFYGEKFLRNIGHVTIGQLQEFTKQNNLNIAQIFYLIVNIEPVIFNN